MTPASIGAAFLFLAAAGLFAGLDRLIYLQYRDHRAMWEADGRMPGLFWRPPEAARGWFLGFRRDRIWRRWTLRPPDWITASQEARGVLRIVRVALIIGVLGWLLAAWNLVQS